MKRFARRFVLVLIAGSFLASSQAYEINNHADMSQVAATKSVLNDQTISGKLAKLGLRPINIASDRQTFPLATPQIGGGTPLERCFGQYKKLIVDANGNPVLDAQGRE
jgi:hypothetical protein